MSNLNKENAAKVFAGGERKDFFLKSGTSILSTAEVKKADAQRSYISNQILSAGGKYWLGELKYVSEDVATRAVERAEKEGNAANVVAMNKGQER